jgi:hypothetical protein
MPLQPNRYWREISRNWEQGAWFFRPTYAYESKVYWFLVALERVFAWSIGKPGECAELQE